MKRRVNVIGVGSARFSAVLDGPQCLERAAEVARAALADAGVAPAGVSTLVASQAPGLTSDYWSGVLGLPAVELPGPGAGLATGSVLTLARQAVEAGRAECVLALGFDAPGGDTTLARDAVTFTGFAADGHTATDTWAQLHGDIAQQYLRRYGIRAETLAMAAVTAGEHGSLNPLALFGRRLTLDEVIAAEPVAGPLTRLQFCTRVYGAAAVLLCSDDFARVNRIPTPVRVAGYASVGQADPLGESPAFSPVGYALNVAAAQQVYEQTGVGPESIDVCELHDSSTIAAVLFYEALGFCREGHAERFIEDGDNTYGGNMVINPSGGLLGNGYSLQATELAQCAELVRQLRGEAGERQVDGARIALQHHLGVCGTREVTLYRCD